MPKLSYNAVVRSAEKDENAGFCVGCGTKHKGIEPDARKYTCRRCGLPKVYGSEELVLMMSSAFARGR